MIPAAVRCSPMRCGAVQRCKNDGAAQNDAVCDVVVRCGVCDAVRQCKTMRFGTLRFDQVSCDVIRCVCVVRFSGTKL